MTKQIIVVNQENYEKEVVQSQVPVLIDFWAPWCGPCMSLMPVLEALAPMYEGRLKIVKINADENNQLIEQFGVRGLPQMFILKGGVRMGQPKERSRTRLSIELDTLLD
ncbi:thioredoxin family protein [Undibacterium sp. RuTC16W]|uniref:thioredoxin family protein n=1 Tax=Undibacterium sp. RuTC16W TaxID=3413048 RepID=UPI003BF274B2